MAHSHVSLRVHCIFATKGRRKLIPPDFKPRLWGYIDGVCRNVGVESFAIGGMEDHAHLLLGLSGNLDLSGTIQKIKANSSRFAAAELGSEFGWQVGFGGFSVSISHMAATMAYIRNQERHHAKRTFAEEWDEILRRHGMGP